MILGPRTFVGVLRLSFVVPGARTLKDRRSALVSLRDRIRARFDVSCHEVSGHDLPGRAALLVTSGGLDAEGLRAALDRIRSLAEGVADLQVVDVLLDVQPWPLVPSEGGLT